jgi:nicotinamide riboside kinase/rubrerythrin
MEENLKQHKADIIKIAMFGPESTGKTTLSIQLADYYKTEWAPEFARDYLQEKWDNIQGICDVNDMMPIAYGQTKLENDKLKRANKFLFCDTNLMVTKVFSEVYYNYCDPLLDKAAKKHQYDLFFLTDIDVPWEKDDLRDSPDNRQSVFDVFKASLIKNKKPFITLSGDKASRLKLAVSIIDNLVIAKDMGFSTIDFVQIYEHGIALSEVQKQLAIFKSGIPKIRLIAPATAGNGIFKLSESEFQQKADFFDANKTALKLLKFVPASGAASRMFKFLNSFLNQFDLCSETINAYINRTKDAELAVFIVGMDKLPFFEQIDKKLREIYNNFDELSRDYKNYYFIKLLLDPGHCNFANKPKGVLPFHAYKTTVASPIEEQLYECGFYANTNNRSTLHFTVSESHLEQFQEIVNKVKPNIELKLDTRLEVEYSYQKSSTDTVAVDENNNPVRDGSGKLVFRPGGHGALIENLNQLDADVIFIKNIDNIIIHKKETIALYKKGLAGILLEQQQKVFAYLRAIDENEVTEAMVSEIKVFLISCLNVDIHSNDFDLYTFDNKIKVLKKALDRPIRICGMVKNEGEPGGGPFWVKGDNDVTSLQIVELSQVDLENKKQVKILAHATHFNPVDLVCSTLNYKQERFDLAKYVDSNAGFIVHKSFLGKSIKSYELPGLWNGAMAHWLTVFVEVPLVTFNPVKSVNDLLKSAHQL